jgi:hypothetical protein
MGLSLHCLLKAQCSEASISIFPVSASSVSLQHTKTFHGPVIPQSLACNGPRRLNTSDTAPSLLQDASFDRRTRVYYEGFSCAYCCDSLSGFGQGTILSALHALYRVVAYAAALSGIATIFSCRSRSAFSRISFTVAGVIPNHSFAV